VFDLLRVARAVRTVLGLVGFYRHGWFRAVALWLTCVGVGLALGGASALGGTIALGLWLVLWTVRSRRRRDDGFSWGRHRFDSRDRDRYIGA
jgi:hypothetical protein